MRKTTLALIAECQDILKEQNPMSLRGLFYALVSRGYFENTRGNYQKLSRAMTSGREKEYILWEWIVDNLRQTIKPSSWSGLGDFADTVRDAYRKDFWASQDAYVEIFVEKDAMAGTLAPVTEKHDVSLNVVRGYCSATYAHRIASLWGQIDKPIHAYYLGDFDPSGMDVERDLREKLKKYNGRVCLTKDGDEVVDDVNDWLGFTMSAYMQHLGQTFTWTRLALLPEDFEKFDLVPMLAKKRDTRTKAFEKQHGHKCAELDAVPANELRDRVKTAIHSHIDQASWKRLRKAEAAETKTLDKIVKELKAAG